MASKVFFIHTVSGVVDAFKNLSKELIPQVSICHIADESLIQGALAAGGLTPALYRRVCEHVVAAEQSGAGVIQLTCSSISPCVDIAKALVSVPVFKIDEAMLELAVSKYANIGLIATAPCTLKPSTDLVQEKARLSGRTIKVDAVLCDGAFDAFRAGDMERHDEIVRGHLRGLLKRSDVVLLAQASMARIVDTLGEKTAVPILSSPRLAIERLAKFLNPNK